MRSSSPTVTAASTPPKTPRPQPAPIAESPAIGALCSTIAHRRSDARGALDQFWAEHGRGPLVEHCGSETDRIVTFLWRDEPSAPAQEVLLFVNRLTDERDLDRSLMRRLPGSDLWHLSYRMRRDWRASYCFLVRKPGESRPWEGQAGDQVRLRAALDCGLPDPTSPARSRNRTGRTMSVVELDEAPDQSWCFARRPAVPAGAVVELIAPDGHTVRVYRSRGIPLGASAPVIVVFDGEMWVGSRDGRATGQDLPTTLDNLVADGEIPPCIALFVDSGDRGLRWQQLGAEGALGDWVADRLLPWARRHFEVSADPADVTVIGQSLGAYTALRAVLERPEAIGAALAQSASLWQGELPDPTAEFARSGRVYLEVGAQEWVLREPHRTLADGLSAAGADVRFVEYNGGHDYACWRGGIADGLRSLLGDSRR